MELIKRFITSYYNRQILGQNFEINLVEKILNQSHNWVYWTCQKSNWDVRNHQTGRKEENKMKKSAPVEKAPSCLLWKCKQTVERISSGDTEQIILCIGMKVSWEDTCFLTHGVRTKGCIALPFIVNHKILSYRSAILLHLR